MSVDRTLSEVGVGPGGPDRMTVRVLWALETADVVLVPSIEACAGGIGRAEKIVCAHLLAKADTVRHIPFSMAEHRGIGQRRVDAWEASATAAIEAFEAGAKRVAFATVGDTPMLSTSSYLYDLVSRHVEVKVEVIPGVITMRTVTAASRTPSVEDQEVLPLVPWTVRPEAPTHVCEVSGTVAIYKGDREMTEFRAVLDAQSRLGEAVFDTDLGLPSEHLVPLSEVTDHTSYFGTVLAVPGRSTTGGRI